MLVATYGGDYDGAFCLIPLSANAPTNAIQGTTDNLGLGYIFPGAGASVELSAQLLGWDWGTVINPSVNLGSPVLGVAYTGLVSVPTSKDIQKGDSGGLVYGVTTSMNISAAGIIVGRNPSNYKIAYYSKASVNNYNLGVVRY